MGHDVAHAIFHAGDLVPVVGSPVIQPARVIAIEPVLVIGRQAASPLFPGVRTLHHSMVIAVPITTPIEAITPVIVRRNLTKRHIRRDVVVRHYIAHAVFHADNLTPIIGPPVIQPARVIAVKTALVFRGQAALPSTVRSAIPLVVTSVIIGRILRGQKQRQENPNHRHENSENFFHFSPVRFGAGPDEVPRLDAGCGFRRMNQTGNSLRKHLV